MIRTATIEDRKAILELSLNSGLFTTDNLGELAQTLDGTLGVNHSKHQWLVVEEANRTAGAAYFGPEAMTDGTWNLYYIAVLASARGTGLGSKMLTAVESALRDQGERVLLVETSGLDDYESTRRFYEKHGFSEEARIREFYGAGEDKVIFWKRLSAARSEGGSHG